MKEERIVRRMLDIYVEIPGKRIRGRPNLRWKELDACKIDMTEMGLKRGQDNKQGSMEEYHHQLYRRPQIYGTSQGRRRRLEVYKLNPMKSDNPKDIIVF